MAGVLFLLLAASGELERLTKAVAESGRVIELATPSAERLAPTERIAPGAPPLLSFRFFEGSQRHRFGSLDLVLDDASH
ncbi:MAG: hypothetical protein HYR60_11675 [Acidobacteria bacterium]|nr:hypothetical protein [Acidobacteriota bacterium]MBI3471027.1 hypothetical protein [Candidatus Solibacter usitatus]